MSRLKKRRIAHHKEAELDVTPFMNMMMVLVCATAGFGRVHQDHGDRSRLSGGQRHRCDRSRTWCTSR